MNTTTKAVLVLVGAAAAGATLGYRGTKRTVLKRCKKKVVTECKQVPLIGTDEFCNSTAEEICQA